MSGRAASACVPAKAAGDSVLRVALGKRREPPTGRGRIWKKGIGSGAVSLPDRDKMRLDAVGWVVNSGRNRPASDGRAGGRNCELNAAWGGVAAPDAGMSEKKPTFGVLRPILLAAHGVPGPPGTIVVMGGP